MTAIAVVGAGAWGTALAMSFARTQLDVRLWGRDDARIAALTRAQRDGALPASLRITGAFATAIEGADIVVVAVPAQALRAVLGDGAMPLPVDRPLVICAKGIERQTGCFPSDVAAACRPGHPVAILSGPSFAADVACGLPTALTLASSGLGLAADLAAALGSVSLRLYPTDDVRGVEIGGAAKNVLAIACGIANGRGLGASAGAALVARAFAELSRFGCALGGRPETLSGLSGLGDLVLTCNSLQSRNFAFGTALGRGEPPSIQAGGPVIEGVWTAAILVELAKRAGVEMPICRSVAAVVSGALDISSAIDQLLSRPVRSE